MSSEPTEHIKSYILYRELKLEHNIPGGTKNEEEK